MSLKLIIDNTKKDETEIIKETMKVQKTIEKNDKAIKLSQKELFELGEQYLINAVDNSSDKECLTAERYLMEAKKCSDHFAPDMALLSLYYYMGAYEAAGDVYVGLTSQCDVLVPRPDFKVIEKDIGDTRKRSDYLEISKKNVKRFPRHWAVRAALGSAYLFQDNLKEALRHYTKAVENIKNRFTVQELKENKHMITPIFRIGEILYYQGIENNKTDDVYWRTVRKKLSQAEQLGLNNSDLYYYLGCIELREKATEKAIQYFKKSLSIFEENFDSALELFRIYLKNGEYEKSKEYLNIMKYIDPSNKSCRRAEDILKRCIK